MLRIWPKEGPTILWKKDIGSGWAGPVVVGDRLIAFHRIESEEIIECLDPANGKSLWRVAHRTRYVDDFNFDEGPRSTPIVEGNAVFTLGADGDLRACALDSGKLLWERNVNKDYSVAKGFFGAATSPLVVDGMLLVNVGGKGASVVAFDIKTGDEKWKSGDDAVSYSSPVLGKLGGEELAIFFTREGLLAVKPVNGEIRYQHPWRPRLQASVNAATPIASDGRVYLSTSYGTGAIVLEVNKGKLESVWEGDKSISNHYSTPVLVKGFLYGIDGRQEGGRATLCCVAWSTGKVRWTEKNFGCAGLIHADGLILACRENGNVVLLDPSPESYKELAQASVLDSPVRAHPALANGRLFVRDSKKLIALKVGGK